MLTGILNRADLLCQLEYRPHFRFTFRQRHFF